LAGALGLLAPCGRVAGASLFLCSPRALFPGACRKGSETPRAAAVPAAAAEAARRGRTRAAGCSSPRNHETPQWTNPLSALLRITCNRPRVTITPSRQGGRAPMADSHARLVRIRDSLTPREWARTGAMTATIIGLNVAGWAMLAAAVGGHYHITSTEVFGFGTGILAYTLGMRHAFDADHIAAIDNTTRKLVGEGKRPLSVGFFFSLGHSSVVFVLAVLLNFGIRALDNQVRNENSGLHSVTGIIGTGVSG